ncbi:Para-hydroxybenzoate--polyprenyltransferase, mitochondrial precursor (PHB:polyprenyltransferase) [Lobaria immixta]|nr:Para-hydroxybenzoate--polyprenyltransferase, mitochondrial precursor (PHB:polyprenyltransferase) [Lobaria immixta]
MPLSRLNLGHQGCLIQRRLYGNHAPFTRCVNGLGAGRQLPLTRASSEGLIITGPYLLVSRLQSSTSKKAEPAVTKYPPWTPPQNGFLSILPPSWVPYVELMRLEKPGGLYGFYFVYLIGIGYAASIAEPIPSPAFVLSTSAILLAWNVFLRGAVCTINDNLDREFDRQVARCRTRPIARGAVTPIEGYVWFVIQSLVAAAIVTQLPFSAQCFHHAIPIHFLLSVYPLAKRVTDFPQVVLSVPLAWGVFMSCSAIGIDPMTMQTGGIAAATTCLFVSQAIWIITLDYVNACQDTVDDIKAGVRSMAVRYQNTFAFISVLSTTQVSLMVAAGLLGGMSPIYFIVACGGNTVMLVAMASTVNRSRPDVCAWWFLRGSILVGGTTVVGLFGEYFSRFNDKNTGEPSMISGEIGS